MFIPGKNRGRYPHCHSLYVAEAGVLIDPASDRDRLKRLRQEQGVNQVWLSHWHEDHFKDLDLFDDLPLCIMEPDALPLANMENLLDAYGMDAEFRDDWYIQLQDFFHFRPRTPDRFLRDGETVDLGSTRVSIIAAPGHTPGHAAFYFDAPDLLFMGDYDMSSFGPWYGDRDSDIDMLIRSINHLRGIPAGIHITSHGTGFFEETSDHLWNSYLGIIQTREENLLALLETPHTMEGIIGAAIVYGRPREPRHFFEFGERAIMEKHLERLKRKGLVTRDKDMFVKKRPVV